MTPDVSRPIFIITCSEDSRTVKPDRKRQSTIAGYGNTTISSAVITETMRFPSELPMHTTRLGKIQTCLIADAFITPPTAFSFAFSAHTYLKWVLRTSLRKNYLFFENSLTRTTALRFCSLHKSANPLTALFGVLTGTNPAFPRLPKGISPQSEYSFGRESWCDAANDLVCC